MQARDSILVRRAELSDAMAIWQLVQAFATSFTPRNDSFEGSFEMLLSQESAILLVACDQGQVIGYLLAHIHSTFYANGSVAIVEEIMVSPEARRQGVGSKLMATAEQIAREDGVQVISLATRRASEFYRSIGFEESATYFRKLL